MAEQRILMYLRIFLRFSFQNKPTQLVANVVKIGSGTYIKILPEKSFCKDWICMNYSLQWCGVCSFEAASLARAALLGICPALLVQAGETKNVERGKGESKSLKERKAK